MRGRILTSIAVLWAAVQAGTLLATPATHDQAARNFFAASKMDQAFDAMAVQMTDAQIAANPIMTAFREPILTFLRKYMSWKELEPDLVTIYTKEFSESELKEMAKFYGTPTGQKVLKKMPELTSQGQLLGQKKLEAHVGEFQAILDEAQKKNEGAAKK